MKKTDMKSTTNPLTATGISHRTTQRGDNDKRLKRDCEKNAKDKLNKHIYIVYTQVYNTQS